MYSQKYESHQDADCVMLVVYCGDHIFVTYLTALSCVVSTTYMAGVKAEGSSSFAASGSSAFRKVSPALEFPLLILDSRTLFRSEGAGSPCG